MVTPRLLSLAVLAAAALVAGCGERAAPGAAVGAPFPELRLAALGDARAGGDAVPRGRAVVFNVWATWCEPCRAEMASLESLARKSAGVDVVGLSVDEDANLAKEFLLRRDIRFANFSDPGGRVALGVLGVKALPQTFVIARDGTLVARITGPRDWATEETLALLRQRLGSGGPR